jgi:hypothetical protein
MNYRKPPKLDMFIICHSSVEIRLPIAIISTAVRDVLPIPRGIGYYDGCEVTRRMPDI